MTEALGPLTSTDELIAECLRLQARIERLLDFLRKLEAVERLDPSRQTPVAIDSVHFHESSPLGLTHRETEVLKCIVEGHSTMQVAAILGISFKTAACHRYRVMQKLGIRNTAALVRYSIQNGLL